MPLPAASSVWRSLKCPCPSARGRAVFSGCSVFMSSLRPQSLFSPQASTLFPEDAGKVGLDRLMSLPLQQWLHPVGFPHIVQIYVTSWLSCN